MNAENKQRDPAPPNELPETPASRWAKPFARFFQIESASGVLLLGCAIVAVFLANSPWSTPFADFWQTPIRFSIGNVQLIEPLQLLINDGLMTVFFFLVGLEIKREIVAGELRDPRKAALPIVGAVGGMAVPAGIYLLIQGGQPGQSGWGIPVATDIAFVAGFLALLGSRVPSSLKIMLMSLAIVDDIGAILLIAIFYSADISWVALGFATAGFGVIYVFNRIGVRLISIYVVLGIYIWLAFLKSGVHPTVAGVLLGFMTPSRAWVGNSRFPNVLTSLLDRLVKHSDASTQKERPQALRQLATAAKEGTSPLERLEVALHPWVAFLIMPLFALANAGVAVEAERLGSSVALAVAMGLVIGKPLGIVLFSWIANGFGLARLPSEMNWRVMVSASFLAGIGFTMSIFIAGLALQGKLLQEAKIGTLLGSSLSALLGCVLLLIFLPQEPKSQIHESEPQTGDKLAFESPSVDGYERNKTENEGSSIPTPERRV